MADKVFLRKVLTDPRLRRTLEADPKSILPNATRKELLAIKNILQKVSSLEAQIEALAHELLCTSDPCKIA